MADSRKDIERGRIAQDILDNEIFQDALLMLEDHYKNLWATSKKEEHEERERIIIIIIIIIILIFIKSFHPRPNNCRSLITTTCCHI